MRIVDIGCGSLGLRGLEPDLDITGVDLAPRPDYPGPFVQRRRHRAPALRRRRVRPRLLVERHRARRRASAAPRSRPNCAASRAAGSCRRPARSFPIEPHALLPVRPLAPAGAPAALLAPRRAGRTGRTSPSSAAARWRPCSARPHPSGSDRSRRAGSASGPSPGRAASRRRHSRGDCTAASSHAALTPRGAQRTLKPLPVNRPMSFVRPTTNRIATSRKPTTLARSMTANGIGRPRTFSASAQKMWPPSSGRNGNRLTTASESEISARMKSARGRVEGDRLARHLEGPDDARDLLARLRVVEDLDDPARPSPRSTCHICADGQRRRARPARDVDVRAEADAEQHRASPRRCSAAGCAA